MGYFSNGTEGMIYEEHYCQRCIHVDREPGVDKPCPIWMAHLLFAYEECNRDSNAHTMLDMLIPRTPDGLNNEQCVMFTEDETCA
jgi:hypothetical protein